MKKIIAASLLMLVAAGCNAQTEEQRPLPPVLVAIQAMGDNFQIENSDLSITQRLRQAGESTEAVVEIEQTGIQDDSLAATKSIFTLNDADNGSWKVVKRVDLSKCQQGRGHQDYAAGRCL